MHIKNHAATDEVRGEFRELGKTLAIEINCVCCTLGMILLSLFISFLSWIYFALPLLVINILICWLWLQVSCEPSTLTFMRYRVFIKYCVFSRKFATSPSPVLGCYWLYKKLPANRSDCTLALR